MNTKKETSSLVRYDATGSFEVCEPGLLHVLDAAACENVAAAGSSNIQCLGVNGVCLDGNGRLDARCNGSLNGLC